jgi:hypothetical protein
MYVITMSNRTVRKISKAGFGSFNPAKGFRLLQAKASHTEVHATAARSCTAGLV